MTLTISFKLVCEKTAAIQTANVSFENIQVPPDVQTCF